MVARSNNPQPKFCPGHLYATPAALRAILAGGHSPVEFLDRHVCGDWGELSSHDWRANEEALNDGSRILSAYKTSLGTKFWIITEAVGDDGKRASTSLMLPEEY